MNKSTRPKPRTVGRDAKTGRFISIRETRRRPAETTAETVTTKR